MSILDQGDVWTDVEIRARFIVDDTCGSPVVANVAIRFLEL